MSWTAIEGTAGESSGPFGLCELFEKIETYGVLSRPVPAAFSVERYYVLYERNFVHWRGLANGDIGLVSTLHERMHQIDRFRDDLES
jgi:hypothetical protein